MDQYSWLKFINHFRTKLGETPWNRWVIFLDHHDYHYDDNSFDLMYLNFIHIFILNKRDSDNNQPNDNCPNAYLKVMYNKKKGDWVERFVTTKLTPPYMNKVLVVTRDYYKLDVEHFFSKNLWNNNLLYIKTLGRIEAAEVTCISTIQTGSRGKS